MSLQPQPQPSSRYRQAQSRRCARGDCRQEGLFPAPSDEESKDARAWLCLEHARAANSAWNYYEDKSNEDIERDLRASAVGYRPTWPMTPLRGHNGDVGGERSYAKRGAKKSTWRNFEKSFANIFVEIFAENFAESFNEDAPSFEREKAQEKAQGKDYKKDYGNPHENPHGKIQEKSFDARGNNYDNDARIPSNREERKACRVLDLTPPINAEELKSRYRALAKAHHPDHHIANDKINGKDNSKDKDLTKNSAKNPDEQARQQKQERLKQINVAYSLLQDLWSKRATP